MTTISVIIPTYNRQNLVSEAIQSVLDQGDYNLEIIVVDDGSTDQTRQVVKNFGEACRYVYQRNGGPSAARNTGIKLAQGEYISFLDSDDVWLPNKLNIDLDLFERFPEVAVLAGNAESYIEGQLKGRSVFENRNIDFSPSGIRPFCWSLPIMRLGPTCIMSTLTLKATAVRQFGDNVFDESLRFDEDWDFEFRLFPVWKTMLYEKVVCRKRAFDDGTRGGYSISGKPKSKQEKRLIWQTQATILGRYIQNNDWEPNILAHFKTRKHELERFLVEAELG